MRLARRDTFQRVPLLGRGDLFVSRGTVTAGGESAGTAGGEVGTAGREAAGKQSLKLRPVIAAVVVLACGLAVVVSFTHPFTLRADIVTAIPLAAMLVAQVVFAIRSRRRLAVPGGGSGESPRFRRFIPWLAVFALLTAFELLVFFEQPRQSHPTLSSLSDDLTRWHAGKAALFLAWLLLGYLFLRRRTVGKRAR